MPATLITTMPGFKLFLGSAFNALDVDWLRENEIGAILNMIDLSDWYFDYVKGQFDILRIDYTPLTFPSEILKLWYSREVGRDIRYMNIPINDDVSTDLFRVLPKAVAFIDASRAKGTNILVHCHAGQSRSVAVVVAWVLKSYPSETLQSIISQLSKMRKSRDTNWHILPNSRFPADLIKYCLQTLLRPEEECMLPEGNGVTGWK